MYADAIDRSRMGYTIDRWSDRDDLFWKSGEATPRLAPFTTRPAIRALQPVEGGAGRGITVSLGFTREGGSLKPGRSEMRRLTT